MWWLPIESYYKTHISNGLEERLEVDPSENNIIITGKIEFYVWRRWIETAGHFTRPSSVVYWEEYKWALASIGYKNYEISVFDKY